MGIFHQLQRNPATCKNSQGPPFLLLGVRDMHRALAVLLLFTMMCGIIGCSHGQQLRKEASLREALMLLRGEISQFTLDHQRAPSSLAELISSGYMKQLPTDPFTGRNDTWRVEKSGEHFDIRSGSDAVSSQGTRYSSW
jgi:general secretion pathway protein G